MNRRTFAQALAGLFAFPSALFGVVREAMEPVVLHQSVNLAGKWVDEDLTKRNLASSLYRALVYSYREDGSIEVVLNTLGAKRNGMILKPGDTVRVGDPLEIEPAPGNIISIKNPDKISGEPRPPRLAYRAAPRHTTKTSCGKPGDL